MSAPEPTRYLVCDGTRVIELETVPTGGYRFDPPPDSELDGRCDRPADAFWHFDEEPPPPETDLLRELAALHAAAAADPDLEPGTRVLVARHGAETVALFSGPEYFGGGYSVRCAADPGIFTQAFSLSECFEMIADVRQLWADDAAEQEAAGPGSPDREAVEPETGRVLETAA